MKIILHQMMNSLGWPEPYFTVMHKGRDVYVCDIYLSPDHNYIEEEGSKITIAGAAAPSEADAVESSCKDAILLLESCYRIRLVDVNYNSRSHAERCVAEAQDALQSAHYIGNKILGEWEMMVDGIHKFQQHCTDLAVKHTGTKFDDEVYNVKRECAVYADQLCKTCLADLHLAKRRFVNAGTWTDV
jgi:hypothetical protein